MNPNTSSISRNAMMGLANVRTASTSIGLVQGRRTLMTGVTIAALICGVVIGVADNPSNGITFSSTVIETTPTRFFGANSAAILAQGEGEALRTTANGDAGEGAALHAAAEGDAGEGAALHAAAEGDAGEGAALHAAAEGDAGEGAAYWA
jgi:hypothetical protein